MGKQARLITWTEVQMPINPNFEAPYTVALVTPEGAGNARVVSRLIDVAGDQLRCDMPLRLDFVELSNQQKETFIAPVYRPA